MTREAPNITLKNSSLNLDKATNGPSTTAPKSDATICSPGGSKHGGDPLSIGARASEHSTLVAASRHITAPEKVTAPFPPPPLPEGGTRGGGEYETQQGGGGTPWSGDRMSALATAILVGCLRGNGRTTGSGGPDLRDQQPRIACKNLRPSGGEGDDVRFCLRGEAAVAAAIAPEVAVVPSYREKVGLPPPPPPPPAPTLLSRRRSRGSRRFVQAESTKAPTEEEKKNLNPKPPPRRMRRKKRSLPWRRGRDTSASTTAAAATKEETPHAAQVFSLGETTPTVVNQVDPENNQTESVSAFILNDVESDGRRSRSTALQKMCRDRQGGECTAEVFAEVARLSAVSRVPEMLNAPSPLLQELGVVILEREIEELEEDKERRLDKMPGEDSRRYCTTRRNRTLSHNWSQGLGFPQMLSRKRLAIIGNCIRPQG